MAGELTDTEDAHAGLTQVEEDAHGGLTQVEDNIPLTQYEDETEFASDLQSILKEDFTHDPDSVKQTGILVEENGNPPSAGFFFVNNGISHAVIGSGYTEDANCDVTLDGKHTVGISNKALQVSYDSNENHLSILILNRNSVLLRRAQNRGTTEVKRDEQHDIYHGDRVIFGKANIVIHFHNAPLFDETHEDGSGESAIAARPLYVSQRGSTVANRKIQKLGQKAVKAGRRLSRGKLNKQQKQDARIALQQAHQRQCPCVTEGHCGVRECPFKHVSLGELETENIVGVVDQWHPSARSGAYGFIKSSDGRRFYFRMNGLAQDFGDVRMGTHVIFASTPPPFGGGSPVAINIQRR
jgi:hypothetical protein